VNNLLIKYSDGGVSELSKNRNASSHKVQILKIKLSEVTHLHGSLHKLHCFNCRTPYTFSAGILDESEGGRRVEPPVCNEYRGPIRSGVVWVGESSQELEKCIFIYPEALARLRERLGRLNDFSESTSIARASAITQQLAAGLSARIS
jgi:hypothetical protein